MAVATETQTAPAQSAPARFKLWPLADGFLVGGVAGATFRSIGWFAGLFLAFAFVQAARTVAVSNVPINLALQSLALQLPRIILFTIPASLLYGTVSTFTEMSSRGEVTALMCGGMSLRRMLRAPLIFAAILTLVAFWLQEVVVPDFELRKSNLTVTAALAILKTQQFEPLVDKRDDGTLERVVQARHFDPFAKVLEAPTIQLFRPDGTLKIEIRARRAAWDARARQWVFQDGVTRPVPDNPAEPMVTNPFRQYALKTDQMPAPDKWAEGEKSARDQIDKQNFEMVSWRQLAAHRAELIAQLPASNGEANGANANSANANGANANDADANGANARKLRKEIRRETYGIHDKFATPLVVMAMLLVGAPLGVRPQRTASAGLAMGISLMVILGYYLLWTFCTQWGKGGGQAPVFAAYLPVAIIALTGTISLLRKS